MVSDDALICLVNTAGSEATREGEQLKWTKVENKHGAKESFAESSSSVASQVSKDIF